MSRAPYASRKEKKPELEPLPVIRTPPNVEADADDYNRIRPHQTKPTAPGKLVPPKDTHDIHLQLLRDDLPRIAAEDEIESDGMLEITQAVARQATEPVKIIGGLPNVPAEVPVKVTPIVTEPQTVDPVKVDPSAWMHALKPQTKGEPVIIRGLPDVPADTPPPATTQPTQPTVETTDTLLRRLLRRLERS